MTNQPVPQCHGNGVVPPKRLRSPTQQTRSALFTQEGASTPAAAIFLLQKCGCIENSNHSTLPLMSINYASPVVTVAKLSFHPTHCIQTAKGAERERENFGDNGAVPTTNPSSHGSTSVAAARNAPAQDNMQVDQPVSVHLFSRLHSSKLKNQIDIKQSLHVPAETWRRIQAREKDSMFVKDLLVAVWDPAQFK
ncbi:uncharacterized protein [Dermacentor albipictus]|uniref:uncharacterized protein n=1 Tax=Dermacentor albipictus TaxID=60249 RepID=UPI0038FCDBC0